MREIVWDEEAVPDVCCEVCHLSLAVDPVRTELTLQALPASTVNAVGVVLRTALSCVPFITYARVGGE